MGKKKNKGSKNNSSNSGKIAKPVKAENKSQKVQAAPEAGSCKSKEDFEVEKPENLKKNIAWPHRKFYECYGLLGILAGIAVIFKVLFFYDFVGLSANFDIVCILTCCFVFLLFKMFSCKWISAVLYLALSVLMFCDVTYCSYFNNYLSVNLLGSAGMLGDITASIKEVIKPEFFLMFLDSALVFACLIVRQVKKHRERRTEKLEKAPSAENVEEVSAGEKIEKAPAAETGKSPEYAEKAGKAESSAVSARVRKILLWLLNLLVCLALFIGLAAFIVMNPAEDKMVKSVSNQEIITYHIKDIIENGLNKGTDEDKGGLSAFEDNYDIEKLGPLFGVAEGRNLIVIQLESFQNFVINREYNGQEITPVLNSLIEDQSIYFDNYYHQTGLGNTSDAEFATNNSIYGSMSSYTNKLYLGNYFRGLPVLLSEQGYETAVFHAYEDLDFWTRKDAYPGLGFRTFYGGLKSKTKGGVYEEGQWIGWGIADHVFYPQTVEIMEGMSQPFYSFLISLSNHHPFDIPENLYTLELLPDDEGTLVGSYLESVSYTDWALGQFLEELKKSGLYENSIIAIYGDHVGLTHSDEVDAQMTKLLGHTYDFDDMMNVPLVIHIPNADKEVQQIVHTAGGQLDFLPTMAYLLGFDELDTIYLGHNILTEDEGFAAVQTYMPRGSFFTDEIGFEMSRDGVFENSRAWDLKTKKEVAIDDYYDEYLKAVSICMTSDYILKSDALRSIYLDGVSTAEAGSKNVKRAYPTEIYEAGYPDEKLIGKNSAEAIENTYYGTHYQAKTIRFSVTWNEESLPIMRDEATGKILMTHTELAEWMEQHGDVTVVASMEKSGEWFLTCMKKENEDLIDRIIVEFPSLSEYSGNVEAIVNISKELAAGTAEDRLIKSVAAKMPWAVLLEAEDANDPENAELIAELKKYTKVYVPGVESPYIWSLSE